MIKKTPEVKEDTHSHSEDLKIFMYVLLKNDSKIRAPFVDQSADPAR